MDSSFPTRRDRPVVSERGSFTGPVPMIVGDRGFLVAEDRLVVADRGFLTPVLRTVGAEDGSLVMDPGFDAFEDRKNIDVPCSCSPLLLLLRHLRPSPAREQPGGQRDARSLPDEAGEQRVEASCQGVGCRSREQEQEQGQTVPIRSAASASRFAFLTPSHVARCAWSPPARPPA